jgi:integrase
VLQLSLSQARVLEPGQHMQVALGEVLRLLGGDRALLFELSADGKELHLMAGRNARGASLDADTEWDSTLVSDVQRKKRPQVILRERDSAELSADRPPRRERLSIAAAPLLARGELVGTLYLESEAGHHAYDKEDMEILLGLCNQVALTLMTTRAVRLELEGALARRRLAEQQALLQGAGRMAAGDLQSVIEVPPGELAILAEALESMRKDLRIKFQKLEQSNVEIKKLNEELRRQIEQRSQRLMEVMLRGDERPSTSHASQVAPGRMLGEHYKVIRTLGKGAMGSVFEVERTTDQQRLAAKVLSEQSDRTALLRFAREAQILARLDHPNLVAITDIDITAQGVLFLVMELVNGTTLKLCRERYRDPAFATPVIQQMAAGLHAIHARGIIHRDLKPANRCDRFSVVSTQGYRCAGLIREGYRGFLTFEECAASSMMKTQRVRSVRTMARPKSPPRAKLYEERLPNGRTRYRVRVIEDGHGQNNIFSSQPEALAFQAAAEREMSHRSGRPISALLDEYFAEKELLGKAKHKTCAEQQPRLRYLLREHLNARITDITPKRAQALYEELIRRPSEKTGRQLETASHRFYLELGRSFFAWAVRKGHLLHSPFKDVRPVGRPATGKRQLRASEAERFMSTALRLFDAENDGMALASALLLIFGLRASEALSRRVRDVDGLKGKWLLWIDDEAGAVSLKTRNARRHYEVPSFLVPRLEKLVAGRPADDWLFGANPAGGPKCRQLLWSAVRRICAAAEVPPVCPHSLRGLNATLGVEAGVVPHAVAAALGHGSFAVTAKHYAQPEAIVSARTARVIEVLDLEQPAQTALDQAQRQAVQLLQALDPASLSQVLAMVRANKGPSGSAS